MFKGNQQIPLRQVPGISRGATRAREERVRGGGWRTCACELQGPGEQEQAREPGGWDAARRGPPPRRPALHRGLRVRVPPSSLAHKRGQPAGNHSSPSRSQEAPPWPPALPLPQGLSWPPCPLNNPRISTQVVGTAPGQVAGLQVRIWGSHLSRRRAGRG